MADDIPKGDITDTTNKGDHLQQIPRPYMDVAITIVDSFVCSNILSG